MPYCKNCGKGISEIQLENFGSCPACIPSPSPRTLLEEYFYEKTGKKFIIPDILIKEISENDFEKQFFKGRSRELIEFYRELLTSNPKEKEIWEKLCFVLYMKGYFWEVKKVAIEALEIFENDVTLLGYLAEAYKLTGGKDNADVTKANNKIPKFGLGLNVTNKDIEKDLKKVKKWKKNTSNCNSIFL